MKDLPHAPYIAFKSLLLAASLALASVSHADILASWDALTNAGTPFPATTVDPNIQGTPAISGGTGVGFDFGGTSGQYDITTADPNAITWTNSGAAAITAGHYITFTVQAASGYQLNLNGGSFDFAWDPSGNASTRVDQVALFSSVDGFTSGSEIASISTIDDSPWAARTSIFNITGSQFDGLTSPVEFRLYLWNGGTPDLPAAAQALEGVSSLNGSIVAVPEPSAYALFGGLLALGACLIRRRRART